MKAKSVPYFIVGNDVGSFHDRRVLKTGKVLLLTTVVGHDDLWFIPKDSFPAEFKDAIAEFERRLEEKTKCLRINQEFTNSSKHSKNFGFERNLEAEKILELHVIDGIRLVEIQWKDCKQTDFELYDEVKRRCPLLLVDYLVGYMPWPDANCVLS